jgi:hypothetical protein
VLTPSLSTAPTDFIGPGDLPVTAKSHLIEVAFLVFGAAGGDRTHDPWLRRPILYPLSYSRIAVGVADYLTRQRFDRVLQVR